MQHELIFLPFHANSLGFEKYKWNSEYSPALNVIIIAAEVVLLDIFQNIHMSSVMLIYEYMYV